jgi:hypothetical protein
VKHAGEGCPQFGKTTEMFRNQHSFSSFGALKAEDKVAIWEGLSFLVN